VKTTTILLVAGGAAALWFAMSRRTAGAASGSGLGNLQAMGLQAATGGNIASGLLRAGDFGLTRAVPSPTQTQSASAPSLGQAAKGVVQGAAGAAAVAGCNAVPGVGTALSPLCGAGGAYIGGKAYDYAEKGVNYLKGLF
jgi:hypothetical protein